MNFKIVAFVFFIFPSVIYAQKLPNIQTESVYAPGGVKIDGKANEWGSLKAKNNSTEISYTMANDDKNLYLVIQATDEDIVNKIVGGGITLIIQDPIKKK